MDKTALVERIVYARVFFEISAANPLPKYVCVEIEAGADFQVEVEFEATRLMCYKCKSFGHVGSQCPTRQVVLQSQRKLLKLRKSRAWKKFKADPPGQNDVGLGGIQKGKGTNEP